MCSSDFLDLAEDALRRFAEKPLRRDDAAKLLTVWSGRSLLSDADELELLARFDSPEVRHAAT